MSNTIYTREELKIILENSTLYRTSKDNRTTVQIKLISEELKEQIIFSTQGCRDERFSERIFWILNDIAEYPTCQTCGKQWMPRFYGIKGGYNGTTFCSNHCIQLDPIVRAKIEKTNVEQYGTPVAMHSPKIQLEMRENSFNKSGYHHHFSNPEVKAKKKIDYETKTSYENPGQNPEVQQKMADTYEERTGYRNPNQNPEIKHKIIQTNLERRNVESTLQCPITREKGKQTYFEKTGYEHNSQNPEVQLQRIRTSQEKYGVDYPMQNAEVFVKQQHTANSYKKLITPLGEERMYMGYEGVALKELFITYTEDDIISDRYGLPEIWYFMDKKRRYYPDIFIPSKNLIIEVKSTWTYGQDEVENVMKRRACLDAGFNFQFWICSDKKVLEIISG